MSVAILTGKLQNCQLQKLHLVKYENINVDASTFFSNEFLSFTDELIVTES